MPSPHAGPAADDAEYGDRSHRGDLLDGLNPAQLEAVTHGEGPLLVVAGAGSGKTRVLTHRIAHLIRDHGVSPFEVLAITFTNKAAGEMKERIGRLVGPVAQKMWVSTFHSACVRILRRDAGLLGYPSQFTIYDQADAVRLTGYVIRDLNIDPKRFPPRSVHATISAAKNEGLDVESYAERASVIHERRISEIYAEYQARLQRAGAMDFDDLLAVTVELFRAQPEVLDHYRRRFGNVLVDEYQDTNPVQNDLVMLLGEEHRNVCVVGDSDQCLPPGTEVRNPGGTIPIESVRVGDTVLGTLGGRELRPGTVTAVKEGRSEGWMALVHVAGRVLDGTPHHIVPARTEPIEGKHLVYLMYRADRGYRIGRTKGLRPSRKGGRDVGYRVRVNQEHADKLWVLRVCDSLAEAAYYEAWFAATYGLPTVCFHALDRDLALDDRRIQRLYDELDTETPAKRLMDDWLLHPDFPHHRPQNGARRQTLNLTMFSDIRGRRPGHRVQWSSNRTDVAERLTRAGVEVRGLGGERRGYRVETARTDYRDALELARRLADAGGLDIRRRMSVAGHVYDYTPLSHLREGMLVLVEGEDGRLVEAPVESVEYVHYSGPVYDLEVDGTHTYVADGVLVHNSVYRFRGADMRNILEFEETFPDATVVVLEQNYRSTQTILDAANAVITNNVGRKPKDLWTEAGRGDPIVRFQGEDEADEAQWVAHELARLHEGGTLRWSDMAVFYRTNAQSRVVEESFLRAGIPYRVVGGTRFYDRKEIKDALAYLRAVVNPTDEVSVKRVLNVPKRGVGDQTVGRLDAYARTHGIAFVDALRRWDDAGASPRSARGIEGFLDLVDQLDTELDDGPATLLERILERSGYDAELEASGTIEDESRRENLAELVGVAREFETVDEFLEQVSLVADTDQLPDSDDPGDTGVVLMTLHAAKGLEFPVVFLVGMEEGVFPHMRSLTEPAELEEERRLCYVGITRARERLYLSHAWCRSLHGSTQYNPPSRFLDEVPAELLEDSPASRSGRSRGSERRGGWESTSWAPRGRERAVDRATRPAPPQPSGADRLGIRVGDDVRHSAWGEGVVLLVEGAGDKAEAVVRFPSVGEKRLLLSWAPLEKL
jgi:DNA helicase II / ATP-dependent DNA helicase PcrA